MVDISVYKRRKVSIDGTLLFSDAARAYGLEIRDVVVDSNIHRVNDKTSNKKNNDAGWYVLSESSGVWFGAFGSWYRDTVNFCSHSQEELTPIQKTEIKKSQDDAKIKADRLREEAAQKAESAAENLEPINSDHPYLLKKKIQPHGALKSGDNILIPIQDIKNNIISYQTISPTGEKRYLSKGQKKGGFYQIGALTHSLYICEGFATGATIHEITGSCVFVAFDRTGLAPVAAALRSVYSNPITVCSDNDQWTQNNPGLTDARMVASSISNCIVAYPTFKDTRTKPTDFNDLYILEGPEAVREQLRGSNVTVLKSLPLVFADDVKPVLDTADFVEDLLCDNQFSVIYGESNCGKTFFMLDLALHVALGIPWRGKAVEQGSVVYAALEGGHGTKNRLDAFRSYYNITASIPMGIVPCSVNFLDMDGDVPALIRCIAETQERYGPVKLIIIDTLARAMSGGDENSSQDMGKMIINADLIRSVTGAHIAFIHHSGKDALKGARGHSSLRAAVDTEIEISRVDTSSPSQIKIVKQREMEMIDEMAFGLHRVILGTNNRGKEVSSCVVLPAETIEKIRTQSMTNHEKFIYDAIVNGLISHGQGREIYVGSGRIQTIDYHQLAVCLEDAGYKNLFKDDGTDTANQATLAARLGLKNKGYINFNRTYIWITDNI